MARTMKRIVITAILLILLAALACGAVVMCSTGTPLEDARTSALNAIVDNAGVKDRVKGMVDERVGELADKYGIPREWLDAGVEVLDIDDWKVVNTPADAEVQKTVEVDVGGAPVQITTYDDPSVISVKGEGALNTFGQTITLEVPESAQGLTGLLPYLDAAEELGAADLLNALASSGE